MKPSSFRVRSNQTEHMDEQVIPADELAQCLAELAWINRLTLAYRPTLDGLKRLLSRCDRTRAVSVLDVGSGGGDTLRRIARWARRRNQPVTLTGIDRNPVARAIAARHTRPDTAITYVTGDIFAFSPDQTYDVIISSLLTHHLSRAQIVTFIHWMNAHAKVGWLINDLHRHPVPYHVIAAAVRLFSRNRLIRHDAPVSVARSFTRDDWHDLVRDAGLARHDVCIRWHFPFRYSVSATVS